MQELLISSVLTKKQVCEILNISPNTLRSYLKEWGMYAPIRNKKILHGKDLKLIYANMEGTTQSTANL